MVAEVSNRLIKLRALWALIFICVAGVIWNTVSHGVFASAKWNVPLFVAIMICNMVRHRINREA
jgi:hypothetical protein